MLLGSDVGPSLVISPYLFRYLELLDFRLASLLAELIASGCTAHNHEGNYAECGLPHKAKGCSSRCQVMSFAMECVALLAFGF